MKTDVKCTNSQLSSACYYSIFTYLLTYLLTYTKESDVMVKALSQVWSCWCVDTGFCVCSMI